MSQAITTAVHVIMRPGWERDMDPYNDRMLSDIGNEIADDARFYVPVRTGALKASIFSMLTGQGSVIIGATEDYAAEVELGTSRMSAQPYLRPALFKKRS